MKAPQIMRLICAVVAGVLPLTLHAFYKPKGPDPRYTAAPGESPLACASAGCHTDSTSGGPINFHGGGVTATFSQGSVYTPGIPITITVKVSDAVNRVYGFQMSARRDDNSQAGRFAYAQGADIGVVCENEAPRTPNGNCPTSAPIEYIEQTLPATAPWTFTWTPPPTASGPVHFYIAGNAVNDNGHKDGDDHVYTARYTLTPIGDCVSGTPQISGVISAGAFGARTDFAAGTWLEVYGSNFSSVLKEWAGADFNGAIAPQVLDRVRVKVNGKDAYTRFISSGQVNVQAPANDIGPMSVTVSNCDKTSAPVNLNQVAAAPGMLTGIPATKLIAFAPDGTTRAAKPGEMVVAYGIGFGPTTPAIAPGEIAGVLTSLASPLAVTIGGVQLTQQQIVYGGLAPGFVGLYQFNLIVPDVPDGDQPVTIRVGTAAVPQTMTLAVKR